ncbi:FGGY-family carbohydrate kinase [Microbacterium sp. XT11]|uniref:FGGY-family carbohydrate kinase n=1 Tax=Microbacterium sp. XT11 TaxID=367477 RepID=UPI00083202DC|nr:FGGY family carbohydrate kinase [Microbacterium sp. XT11]
MQSTRRTPVVCGVDIGSTNVKVVLLTPAGEVASRLGRGTPRDPHTLCIEGPAVLAAVEGMIAEACADDYVVQAVCVAGMGEDGVLVDHRLAPVTPALPWFDGRRQEVMRLLRVASGAHEPFDVAEDASRTLVGWAWARQQPGAEAAASWVAIADLPGVLWSRRAFLSDTLASRTGAWRARDRVWDPDRVNPTLGSLDLLPPVVTAGEVIGAIHAPQLRERGVLSADAFVVAGGHDHPIGGWGVDRMAPGAVLDSMGTAEVVVAQRPEPPSVREGDVDLAPGIRSSGTTLLRVEELSRNVEWASRDPEVASGIRDILEGREIPAELDGGSFRPGSRGGGTPSYEPGAPRDPRRRAADVLVALAHLGRDAVSAVSGGGVDPSGVRLAGGWARSPGWVQIKERVNGYRTEPVVEPEVTAVGAALLAAAACAWTPDPAVALGGRIDLRPR